MEFRRVLLRSFQIAMAQRVWVSAEHGVHAAGGVSRKAGRVTPGFQIPKVPKFGLRSWRQANVICFDVDAVDRFEARALERIDQNAGDRKSTRLNSSH